VPYEQHERRRNREPDHHEMFEPRTGDVEHRQRRKGQEARRAHVGLFEHEHREQSGDQTQRK
jgi:hypothetical protein